MNGLLLSFPVFFFFYLLPHKPCSYCTELVVLASFSLTTSLGQEISFLPSSSSKYGLWTTGGPETFSGALQNQNYFHNNIKTCFLFFIFHECTIEISRGYMTCDDLIIPRANGMCYSCLIKFSQC